MPQVIPSIEVTNYLNIIAAAPYPGGPLEVQRITESNLLYYYNDVETCIKRQLDLFNTNNAYLLQAITCFNDTQLQNVGIFVNKNVSSPPITDPIMLINCDYALVELTPNISSPPVEKTLTILGNSSVDEIYLYTDTVMDEVYIGSGSTVDKYDGSSGIQSPPSATITGTIWLPFSKSRPAKLNSVVMGTIINQLVKDEGSYYGGVKEDPQAPCADAVTGMQAMEVTKNGILVSWTPPASYLFINPFYRKTNSPVWILATEEDGDFVDDTGFVFRNLEVDTWYDFKATVVCTTGGLADTTIITKTICCGAGTILGLYKSCLFVAKITSTPSSPKASQVLCNGVIVDLEYPPGPTLTVPYFGLVNAQMSSDLVFMNQPQQLFPYTASTGTWNAAATPLGEFPDGSTVTVGMSLPV